jgi:hypothetical protein
MTGGSGRAILFLLLLAGSAYVALGEKLGAQSAMTPVTRVAAAPHPSDSDARQSGNARGENIVTRCDHIAVAAADRDPETRDRGKAWRQARQLAFRRCVDAQLHSPPR